jgi:hypothetical protein
VRSNPVDLRFLTQEETLHPLTQCSVHTIFGDLRQSVLGLVSVDRLFFWVQRLDSDVHVEGDVLFNENLPGRARLRRKLGQAGFEEGPSR